MSSWPRSGSSVGSEGEGMESRNDRLTRRQFMRGLGGAGLGALGMGSLGSFLAACSSKSPTSTTGGTGSALNRDPGTLVVAMDAFVSDFDPASYFLLSGIVPNFGIYESLLRMKGSSATETEPWLAERSSTNPDKSVWTFKLRSGVKFSDGTPFDGDALKAAWTRTITANLGAGSTLSTYITDPGTQIVVKDPGTVVMDLGIPVPRFDLLLASQYGTGIVNPNVESQGKNHGHDYLASHSAGTGPYMVESVAPNDQIVMVRNPNYWQGWTGSHFEKVLIKQVIEDSSRRQGMESGDFDIAFPATPQDTDAMRSTPGISVGDQKVLGMEYVILGAYGPLASPEARRAINLLFPNEDFVSSVMKGTLDAPNSVLPDLMLYAAPGTYTPTVDVEQANDAFVADISTPKPESERPNMAYWFWWPEYNSPADFCFPILSEDATPNARLFNGGYYINDTVNHAINGGFTESDPDKLTRLWRQAQVVMGEEDPPWIPLGQIIDTSYLRSDVQGYVPNPVYVLSYDFYAL